MERSRKIFLKIASASDQVVAAANEYADLKDSNGVSRCHFQLEEDMRRISVACTCLAGILENPPPDGGPVVDVRIQDWLDTNEPQECLNTLHRMKGLLVLGQDAISSLSWVPRMFGTGRRSTTTQDKIKEAFELFNSYKGGFHFLFSLEVWNNEKVARKQIDMTQDQDRSARGEFDAVEPWFLVPSEMEVNISASLDVEQDSCMENVTLGESIAEKTQATLHVDNNTTARGTVNGNLKDGHPATRRMHEARTDEQQEKQEKKLEEILKWLDGLNCAERQDATLLLRQEDTCKWLLDTTQYRTWKEGRSAFLWLRGKAGAGKSVLVSFVIDSFRKARREGEILIFFYCDFRTERSTSSAEVIRSVLSQLLRQLRGRFVDHEDILDDLIKAKEWGGGTLNNTKELAEFTSRAASVLSQQPLVVVDALDECKDAWQLIQALMVIREQVRLFVTSRPLHTIMDDLSGIPFVSLEDMADKLSADIALHASRELDARHRLRDLDLGLKMEIRSELCEKADGMFRWVQCSIDALDRCMTRKEVRNALDNLPKGLEETYERILHAIDTEEQAGKLARRSLIWLVAALRPLRLSEIMEALSINLGTRTLDLDIGPMHSGALLDACGSLVTYTEKTDIVTLAHSSVKEYLIGRFIRYRLPQYHINLERAHLLLARSCMCYISICLDRAQGSALSDTRPSKTNVPSPRVPLHPQSLPLLNYVLDDALDHFGYLGSTFKSILPEVTVLADVIQCHSWIWDHVYTPARWDISNRPHWPTARHDFLLYILVAFAPNSLMSAVFRRAPLKPKEGTNPLVYASYFNKNEHARILLSQGAKLNQRGWETVGYRQSLPIEVAFRNRHYAMVVLFVEEGSTVPTRFFTHLLFQRDIHFDAPDPRFIVPSSVAKVLLRCDELAETMSSCLDEAASLADKKSNQLLIFRNATEQDLIVVIRRFVQVADEHFAPHLIGNFIRFAVAQGYLSVLRYLLTTLDTPLPSNILLTLHHYPGRWKTARMIQFLVDNGADVLKHTRDGDSVLHAILWAACDSVGYMVDDANEDDILEAVKFVVRHGCDPLERDSWGNTPLHTAVEQGYISVARHFLALGAPLPPNIIPALNHKKARHWCTAPMICFLFENDVDITERTGLGDSVLHISLMSLDDEDEILEVMKVVVDHGCNPLEADSRGNTPLQIAVDRGYVSVARYLLAFGALLPPTLLFTSDHGPNWRKAGPDMIRFMVENGPGILAHTNNTDPTLHIVLRYFDNENSTLEVMKALIDKDCDPLEVDSRGKTLLHIAVERGYISVARYLLTLGALLPPNLLVTSSRGQPSWATTSMIHFLVENGVDILGHTSDGDSVLHIVLQRCESDVTALEAVKVLVRHGCDPFEADSCGNTPLRIAIQQGHFLVTRYLLTLATRHPPERLVSTHRYGHRYQHPPTRFRFLTERHDEENPLAHISNGDPIFHTALQAPYSDNEALEAVKLLVGYGCNPLEANIHGQTPLHLAVQKGYVFVTRYLLTLGASIPSDLLVAANAPARSLSTEDMIPLLVENGVNVLVHTDNGDTVLHVMLRSTYSDAKALVAMKLLVSRGCDPLEANIHGLTLLHIAVQKGHISVVRYLLTLGAFIPPDLLVAPNAPLWSWRTVHMIHFLVENGVNALARTDDGDTALHIMLRSTYNLNDAKALMAVKYLVGCGCDPLEANIHGQTPLYLAVQEGHVSVSRYLLTLGASIPSDLLVAPNAPVWSWYAVHMIFFLVENGVDVLARADNGDSVLHVMLRSTYHDAKALMGVKFLVSRGCDPLEANIRGQTPLHLAVQEGHISVARYLLSLGASIPPDLLVTPNAPVRSLGTADMIPFLIANGANVLAHAADGDSVLHVTLRSIYDDAEALIVTKFLVSCGCDPLEANVHGETPFYLAVQEGHISVARYLLTLGAPIPPDMLIDLKQWGCSAGMVHFLLESGANFFARTSDGDSVFHVLLESISEEDSDEALMTIKLLVSYGCNPHEANHRGYTPLYAAVKEGHTSVARYLLTLGASVPPDLLVTLNDDWSHWTTVSMIRFLFEIGVNLLGRASNGDSVLHVALRSSNDDDSVLEALKLLVQYGCDPLEANSRGITPLHVAVERGYISAARHLLSLGASVPPGLLLTLDRDRSLWSTASMIRFLFENGVDLLAHSSDGSTVLHLALQCSCGEETVLEAVRLLVRHGCHPLQANSRGEIPLHFAARRGYVAIAQYLITHGASVLTNASNGDTVLHFAVTAENTSPHHRTDNRHVDRDAFNAIRFFVGRGCEPGVPNDSGKTPLHYAVERGLVKTMKYLLSLNIPLPTDILFTAIQSDDNAAYRRHIVETLVTSSCDNQTLNAQGVTPLQAAIIGGKVDVVEYLLSVVSARDFELEGLILAVERAPESVQCEMRRLLSNRRKGSESPDLPPASESFKLYPYFECDEK